ASAVAGMVVDWFDAGGAAFFCAVHHFADAGVEAEGFADAGAVRGAARAAAAGFVLADGAVRRGGIYFAVACGELDGFGVSNRDGRTLGGDVFLAVAGASADAGGGDDSGIE